MDYQEIIYDKNNKVATITFNRPERLNALTDSMRVEILDAVKDASADDDMRVLIFKGAGRGFCAGADLTPRKVLPKAQVNLRRIVISLVTVSRKLSRG